eukprot:NODE_993_length_2455_cov_0.166808.p1 type:complete len:106 gc:universal NODE_993_length_2455_cov_0.166808:2031-2348(+)
MQQKSWFSMRSKMTPIENSLTICLPSVMSLLQPKMYEGLRETKRKTGISGRHWSPILQRKYIIHHTSSSKSRKANHKAYGTSNIKTRLTFCNNLEHYLRSEWTFS